MVNKILSSEHNKPDRKLKNSSRSLNHYPDDDTEEEVSTIEDFKECAVAFEVMLGNELKNVSLFSVVDMKITMISIHHKIILSYRYSLDTIQTIY